MIIFKKKIKRSEIITMILSEVTRRGPRGPRHTKTTRITPEGNFVVQWATGLRFFLSDSAEEQIFFGIQMETNEKNQFNKYCRNVIAFVSRGPERTRDISMLTHPVDQIFIFVDGHPGPPVAGVFAQPQRGRARSHFPIPAGFHEVGKSPFSTVYRFK